MTIRMLLWPWWARALTLMVICAVGLTLAAVAGLIAVSDVVPTAAVIGAVSAAAGAAGAARGQRAHRAYRAALDGLSRTERSTAITAIRRGPLPASPPLRAATTRVGQICLDAAERSWSAVIVTTPILVVLFSAVAVAEFKAGATAAAASFGVLVLLIVAGTAWSWYLPRQVRRRLNMLW